jgi:hypothetical protein
MPKQVWEPSGDRALVFANCETPPAEPCLRNRSILRTVMCAPLSAKTVLLTTGPDNRIRDRPARQPG